MTDTKRNSRVGGRSWPALDCVRWFFALCVVMIHVISLFKWDAPSMLQLIIYPSVPFFFISSGFLLGVKTQKEPTIEGRQETILDYARRILRMFLIWIALYVPLAIASFRFAPEGDATLGEFVFVQARSILMFGEVRFSWPTWYLYSLAIASYALFLHERYCVPKILIMTVGALGVLALYGAVHCGESLSSTIVYVARSLKNMTCGMLYVTIGYALASIRLKRAGSIVAALAVAVTSVCFFALGYPYWEGLGALAAFIMAIQCVAPYRTPAGAYAGKQSVWVYLLHMYIIVPLFYFTSIPSLGPWIFWGVGCAAALSLSSVAIMAQKGEGRFSRFMRRLT